MKPNDILWALVEALCWYVFLVYFFDTIKNPVNIYERAFVLLVIMYVGACSCPFVRKTDAWKRLWGKN